MRIDLKTFRERNHLAAELAAEIGKQLAAGVAANDRASLAVSGGSTPVALFEELSAIDLYWSKVVITLVDERWVATDEADSNEHLVRTRLLRDKAAAAMFIGLKNAAATAAAGEAECERHLRQMPRPFDALILGMGDDGHTASLFPGAQQLSRATDIRGVQTCMGIAPRTAPHERMTLTLPAILDARQIYLHITGRHKKDVLKQAQGEGPAADMPIRFILRQQKTPVSIYWAP